MSIDNVRRLLRGVGAVPPLPAIDELACTRELRAELAATYPRIRVGHVRKLVRKFGLKNLPSGMLLLSPNLSSSLLRMFLVQFAGSRRNASWHPLFDTGSYLVVNPDIATIRVSLWLHFQAFGKAEGRSPHPFIDVEYLSASMPGVPRGEVIDHYLSLPEFWTLDPSPYVDIQAFLLSGRWDGRTHPLTQIVAQGLSAQWVHHRLMLIDNAGVDGGGSRSLAAATLLARKGAPARALTLQAWPDKDLEVSTSPAAGNYTAIPGFFLGCGDSTIFSARDAMLSPDESMINLNAEIVSVKQGETITASHLIFLEGALERSKLVDVVKTAGADGVISPSSGPQQSALEEIIREYSLTKLRVLPFGIQVQVNASQATVVSGSPELATPDTWAGGTPCDALRTAFVIGESTVPDVLRLPEVRQAIDNGAALCVVSNENVAPWLPLLSTRDVIGCESTMLEALRGFIEEDALRLIPPHGGGSR